MLPSLNRLIAFGRCRLITEQMRRARPSGLTHNGIPLNSNSDGFVLINIDEYFSPKIFFKFELIMANCGGIVSAN